MSRRHEADNKKIFQAFSMVMQFGITMIVPVVLCTLLGGYIGNQTDKPIVIIPFFILGALGGFTGIYRMSKGIYEDKKDGEKPNDQKFKKNQ